MKLKLVDGQWIWTGTSKTHGILEIDHGRGVIYFHRTRPGTKQPTLLRICGLQNIPEHIQFIDIPQPEKVTMQ